MPLYDYEVIKYDEQRKENLAKDKIITKLDSRINSCNKEKIELLVMVKSNIHNFERRKTIRETWGKTLAEHRNNDFRTFFVIGKSLLDDINTKLHAEADQYHDMIFVDASEIFYNLPYKLQASFEWAYKRCNYSYYLQVDDDMFINIPSILSLISDNSFPKEKVYLGYLHPQAMALRYGKYNVLESEYYGRQYPPFVASGAIIISYDVTRDLLPYFNTKPPFKLDDVYIGFLIHNMKVKAVHHEGFAVFGEGCRYSDDLLAYHSDEYTTKKKSCIRSLYNAMVDKIEQSVYIKTHYKKTS